MWIWLWSAYSALCIINFVWEKSAQTTEQSISCSFIHFFVFTSKVVLSSSFPFLLLINCNKTHFDLFLGSLSTMFNCVETWYFLILWKKSTFSDTSRRFLSPEHLFTFSHSSFASVFSSLLIAMNLKIEGIGYKRTRHFLRFLSFSFETDKATSEKYRKSRLKW